ncbi:hypothetical protein M9Y10_005220 [Tritrichomonas musculus]|uniref:MIF4G domain-containing protein n=1 Tax=Tritrichomonas musculus TaxID=1915356 RepID=A0ABR2JLA9_9EUKA
MKRSGFNPNQPHQAFTSLQTYNQPDKPTRNKHNFNNHDSSSNYNYQSNRNYNYKKKSSANYANQHKISIERPKLKQAATTAFSIGIGQSEISSSISSPSLSQPEIRIEKHKSPKLEFRSSFNQNIIISSSKTESEELTSDSNESTAMINQSSSKNNLNADFDERTIHENLINDNEEEINENIIQVPIKTNYTPDEILSLKPTSLPSKRILAPGFITLLRFFSEDPQENDYFNYRHERNNQKNFKRNKNNKNFNWKNGKFNKKMALREHSENRFVGLSMVSRAGLSDEFSAEIKRAQAQMILNKLSKVNISSSLQEIHLLKVPISVLIDLLIDTATSDSDFPERNPQIGNMLDFTFRFCSKDSEFKSRLVACTLSKSEEINDKTNPLSPLGSLQSTITWLAALFAGFVITDKQFVDFSQKVIEKQPIERALEIIRTGLYVAGKSLDQRNKILGEPLFDFLQNNTSKHGYTNFLISELFFLRDSGWNIDVAERFQSNNGTKKKAIHIVKRSNSQSIITDKQEINPSLLMVSSSSTSNLAQIANSNTNYNDISLTEEIELLFLNAEVSSDSSSLMNLKSILNFVSNNKLESIIHSCFFLFKKHIQDADNFASFTGKLISTFIDNTNQQNNNNDNTDIKNESSEENNKIIGNNDFKLVDEREKVISIISNEQSLFESIVREEESRQLWFPVFMLNAYLYSKHIISFDIIVKNYIEIPDDCFKPSRILFINKIAEITGVPIEDVEKFKDNIFSTNNNPNKTSSANSDDGIKIIEALINLCNPIDREVEPQSEIAAGVLIRDIFDDVFYDNEEGNIDPEKIKAIFDPYKDTIDLILKKYKVAKNVIINTLHQCEMNEKQIRASIEYFNVE